MEVASDVIYSEAADKVGIDVRVEFGDSRSNSSWDTRAAHFVMDDDRRRSCHKTEMPFGVLPKTESQTKRCDRTNSIISATRKNGWFMPRGISW